MGGGGILGLMFSFFMYFFFKQLQDAARSTNIDVLRSILKRGCSGGGGRGGEPTELSLMAVSILRFGFLKYII